jgi:phosphatidate phosphatase
MSTSHPATNPISPCPLTSFQIGAFQVFRFKHDNGVPTPLIWQLYCELRPFVFGALASQLVVDIAKYSIGRLRPHFLFVCKPKLNCPPLAYVEDYVCDSESNFDSTIQKDIHLSFMSGHSSLSTFGLLYLALFIHNRLPMLRYGLCRPTLQLLLLCGAAYTGFTRISDYKHHWSDVLAGTLNGALFALLSAIFLARLTSQRLPQYYSLDYELTASDSTRSKNVSVELRQPTV